MKPFRYLLVAVALGMTLAAIERLLPPRSDVGDELASVVHAAPLVNTHPGVLKKVNGEYAGTATLEDGRVLDVTLTVRASLDPLGRLVGKASLVVSDPQAGELSRSANDGFIDGAVRIAPGFLDALYVGDDQTYVQVHAVGDTDQLTGYLAKPFNGTVHLARRSH